ncbi:MAG: DUF6182 family protein [Lysobacteraceae bacterium]
MTPALHDPLHETLMRRRLDAVARAAGTAGDVRRTLFVVVCAPDLPALVRGLARVVEAMPDRERIAWLANFTKVRLFAGRPTSAGIAPLLTHVEGDAIGFALLDAEARHPRIADLLVPLRSRTGPAPGETIALHWGDGDGACELVIDVRDLDWTRYLVHVLHLLAEAALGDATFGGRITLQHIAEAPVCSEDVEQLRLDLDATPPTCRALLRPLRDAAA